VAGEYAVTVCYGSWLRAYFERFVALKRAGGVKYITQEAHLRKLDRFLEDIGPPLTHEDLHAFVQSLGGLSPRGRDNVIGVAWQALRHGRLHGAPINELPPRPVAPPGWLRQRPPRLVTASEIARILSVARGHTSRRRDCALHGATNATLFGLLWSTGLRIGEALALDIGDVDFEAGVLTVRRGKFDKSRQLPLRASVLDAITRYIRDPRRPIGVENTSPLFVSTRLSRLKHRSASTSFQMASEQARLVPPLPTLHHLRHSFAVLCVASWYHADVDVNAGLAALSTYLGHRSVQNTRVYLEQNGLLLEQACARFSAHAPFHDGGPS